MKQSGLVLLDHQKLHSIYHASYCIGTITSVTASAIVILFIADKRHRFLSSPMQNFGMAPMAKHSLPFGVLCIYSFLIGWSETEYWRVAMWPEFWSVCTPFPTYFPRVNSSLYLFLATLTINGIMGWNPVVGRCFEMFFFDHKRSWQREK